MDTKDRVAIIGAGPAGLALAADLESRGIAVLVYSHPMHSRHTHDIVTQGCLKIRGKIESFMKLRLTFDLGEVVEFSRIMVLTVPSTGHETVLRELKRFHLRQHTVIAIPGNLISLLKEAEVEVECVLETNLSPYSSRMCEGELVVLGRKKLCYIAAWQQRDLSPAFNAKIQDIFPIELKWCSNVMEVYLSNINGVLHPLMMLMNAGRIESTAGDFLLYRDGLTRSVANAILAVDRVRIKIGEAFGFRLKSVIEVSNECYGHAFTDLVDLARHSGPHQRLKAPPDLDNRNISEDVPNVLACWHSLAEKFGIDASPIKAVIVLAEMATGVDYTTSGRDLTKLQVLETLSRSELIEIFGSPFAS